jgi:hypothetical protein
LTFLPQALDVVRATDAFANIRRHWPTPDRTETASAARHTRDR